MRFASQAYVHSPRPAGSPAGRLRVCLADRHGALDEGSTGKTRQNRLRYGNYLWDCRRIERRHQ